MTGNSSSSASVQRAPLPEGALLHLEFRGISKSFYQVRALQNIDLAVAQGSVHALLGENGSGKSTLLKILGGEYIPDEGQIFLGGALQTFRTPRDAIAAGIAVIHQELQYVLETTVIENLLLGHLPNRFGFVQKHKAEAYVQQELERMGINISPRSLLSDLSIGERQMVEICKAMLRDASIIALDEPTSSLSSRETDVLFKLVRELQKKDKAIIYVSHRMNEIYDLCDACSILRDGKKVADFTEVKKITRDELIHSMVGRPIIDIFNWSPRPMGEDRFEVKDLIGEKMRHPVSFCVRRGEIVGVFGLVGAGRTEMIKVLFGAAKPRQGEIRIDQQSLNVRNTGDAISCGMALCPEDRKEEGIIAGASVAENINISARRHYLQFNFFLNKQKEKTTADHYIALLRIKTPNREQEIQLLSGGNQQKGILSRWLAKQNLKVIIMDEPTRGIDVGAKHEIYNIMYDLANNGCAILMVSSELPEALGVSDRIIVMHDGKITGELTRAEANEQKIMRLALPPEPDTPISLNAMSGALAQESI